MPASRSRSILLTPRGAWFALVLALAAPASAQDMDHDLWGTDGTVQAMARRGSTIFIGGSFTKVGPVTGGGAALSVATGALVKPFPRVLGVVRAVVPDGAGGWYIGGLFTAVGGQPRTNLAHIEAGGLVGDWNPNPDGTVAALAINGSTIYAGGFFTSVRGQPRHLIAALDATSGNPTAWDPNATGSSSSPSVLSLAVGVGGVVYAGGEFDQVGGQARAGIAALEPITGQATPWNPGSGGSVNAIVVDGTRVFVGGTFTFIGGQERHRVAAIDVATGVATAWNPTVNGTIAGPNPLVAAIAVGGGTVYLGGDFNSVGGQARTGLAAVDTATGAALPWNPNVDPTFSEVVDAVVKIGSVVYAGGYVRGGLSYPPGPYLHAFDATTGQATPWEPNPDAWVDALAASGGVIYAGGGFGMMNWQYHQNIAALDATTGAPTDFVLGWSDGMVTALAVSGDTLYAGGNFTMIGGQPRNRIGAVDVATGQATAWDPGADAEVATMVSDGGTLYVGGWYTVIGGQYRRGIAAFDIATGAVKPWNPNPSFNSSVYAIASSGGTVYLGGSFITIGAQTRKHLAAVSAATGAPLSWRADTDYGPASLALVGNTLYVVGPTSVQNHLRDYLAALEGTIPQLLPWAPHPNAPVSHVEPSGGALYVSGSFTEIDGVSRAGLAALDGTSGVVTPWNPPPLGAAGTAGVNGLLAFGNRIYVCGDFSRVGAEPQRGIAAFSTGAATSTPPTSASTLALHGTWPNPSHGDIRASFTLPTLAPARIELLDVMGRRLAARDVGSMGPGRHVVGLAPERSLAPGLYWLRLTQGAHALIAKTVVVR